MHPITLDDLIRVANRGYDRGFGEGLVLAAHNGEADIGDTLALFVAREMHEAFVAGDAGDNAYFIAADYVMTAIHQLHDVYDALQKAAREHAEKEAQEVD